MLALLFQSKLVLSDVKMRLIIGRRLLPTQVLLSNVHNSGGLAFHNFIWFLLGSDMYLD
jgi:hypothetical protein